MLESRTILSLPLVARVRPSGVTAAWTIPVLAPVSQAIWKPVVLWRCLNLRLAPCHTLWQAQLSMSEVRPVNDRRMLRQFIDFPYAKYRAHPHWTPQLRLSEWQQFNPARNPFF